MGEGGAVGGGVEARRVVLEECDGGEGVEHLVCNQLINQFLSQQIKESSTPGVAFE